MSKVIWLTGISGSGKTTIANLLSERLEEEGHKVKVLDGDMIRDFFDNDVGYARQDRIHNVKRIALAAKLLAESGSTVIVANIAPYYEVRDFIRSKIGNYIQVFLKASVGGRIVGSVRAHVREGTCFVGRLIVHPDFQNRGIGTGLLNELERIVLTREAFWDAERFELFTGSRSEKNLYL